VGYPAIVDVLELRQGTMNIPNLITIGRILLVPLTVWLIISEAFGFAWLAFVAAGVSDGVDGYLARRLNQRSELGAYLDPLADKALMVSIYVSLGFLKLLPAWLVILVVSRDILIVGAVILAWVIGKPMPVVPLMVSKVNTAAQIVFAALVLGVLALGVELEAALLAMMVMVAVLTAASGALYLREWVRHMSKPDTGKGSI
jgi:cardiolipin synthase